MKWVASGGEGAGAASSVTCGTSSKPPGRRTGVLPEELRHEANRQKDWGGSQRVLFSSVETSS